jgi:hypothetical protein
VDGVLIRARAKRVTEAGGSEQVADSLAKDDITGAIRAYRREAGVGRRDATAYIAALLSRAEA